MNIKKIKAMKTMIVIMMILLAAPVMIVSQDLLIGINGEKYQCKILNEDSTKVYFKMASNGQNQDFSINKNELKLICYDSVYKAMIIPPDKINMGFGAGLDYGGIGFNLLVYPIRNVGLFAGGGYALAGLGYNAGIKLRLLAEESKATEVIYVTGMYGYNAAIMVKNASELNKFFYGFTLGAGVDVRSKKNSGGYWSLAVLYPIRSGEVDSYLEDLKNDYGVQVKNKFFPVAFSIGYRVILR